jgi:hypothetical protein
MRLKFSFFFFFPWLGGDRNKGSSFIGAVSRDICTDITEGFFPHTTASEDPFRDQDHPFVIGENPPRDDTDRTV